MHLKTLRLINFRSFHDQVVTFDPKVTTLVGENGVGKSTISEAIDKALLSLVRATAGDALSDEDFSLERNEAVYLDLTLGLNPVEAVECLSPAFPKGNNVTSLPGPFRAWLQDQAKEIRISVARSLSGTESALLRVGEIQAVDERFARNTYPRTDKILNLGKAEAEAHLEQILIGGMTYYSTLISIVGNYLVSKYKRVSEFRTRIVSARNDAMEALTGSETASVLLNLKNSIGNEERVRFDLVRSVFSMLFPRYEILAVEEAPGNGRPVIVLKDYGGSRRLNLGHASAGIHQILTMIVNLIGRHDLVLFVEHPEQHLPPHAMRFLENELRRGANQNQIIISTHDPHFVTPASLSGLRRLWWSPASATEVFGFYQASSIPQSK